jgi:membrane-bound lytic murein transglycosylase
MRHPPRVEAPVAPRPPEPARPLSLAALPGWTGEDHFAAFRLFRDSCGRDPSLASVCAEAQGAPVATSEGARQFLEARLGAEVVVNDRDGPGLLTAYFSPEYAARTAPDEIYSGLLRPRPADLVMVDGALLDPPQPGRRVGARRVDGRVTPYATRSEIEAQAGQALAYLKPRTCSSCRSRDQAPWCSPTARGDARSTRRQRPHLPGHRAGDARARAAGRQPDIRRRHSATGWRRTAGPPPRR